MVTEWTQEEIRAAEVEAAARTATSWREIATEVIYQRNLLLSVFKRLHNKNGEIWIEKLIHQIEPAWKSNWTLLAEMDAACKKGGA
jgi:hypothetical protein